MLLHLDDGVNFKRYKRILVWHIANILRYKLNFFLVLQYVFWYFSLHFGSHFFCCCSCTFLISFPFVVVFIFSYICNNFVIFRWFFYFYVNFYYYPSLLRRAFHQKVIHSIIILCILCFCARCLVNYRGYNIYECISNLFWLILVVCLLMDYLYLCCSPPCPVLNL